MGVKIDECVPDEQQKRVEIDKELEHLRKRIAELEKQLSQLPYQQKMLLM